MEPVPTNDAGALGMTALGRLHLRVPEDGGYDEVVIERRCGDIASARRWCERQITRLGEGSEVLEVQVFEERWHHARSWETTQSHPVVEALYVGMPDLTGLMRWSDRQSMSGRESIRRAF